MFCCFPHGAIGLTLVYVVFYALIRTQLPGCLSTDDKKCGTEGVNNLVWVWSTEFFNAFIVGFLSLHLLASHQWQRHSSFYTDKGATLYGGLAFSCISIAFIMNGMMHSSFANSGIDDGRGMKGYYVLTAISYTLMGSSSIFLSILSYLTADRGRTKLMLLAVLNIVAAFFVVFACLATITSQTEDFFVDTVFDEYSHNSSERSVPLKLTTTGKGLWNASYILFWISLALSWGSMAKKNIIFVMGLPNSIAAAGMIVAQLIVAALRIIMFGLDKAKDAEEREESATHHAAPLVFQYSALMTIFFAHNLIFSLFSDEDDVECSDKDGYSEEYPTDESYSSGKSSSQEEKGDDEEGFSIALNGDVIDVANTTTYVHVESSVPDMSDATESQNESLVKSTVAEVPKPECCEDMDRDIETGNNIAEEEKQASDVSSRSLNQNPVDMEETPNKNDSSPKQIESIYDYVSSFLQYSTNEVDQNCPQEQVLDDGGVLPEGKQDDIVSMLISAVKTSAVGDNFAVRTFSQQKSVDNSDCASNGSATGDDNNVHNRAPHTNLLESERPADHEACSIAERDLTSAEQIRPMESSRTESLLDTGIENGNEKRIKAIDKNPVENSDNIRSPSENENVGIEIERPKNTGPNLLEPLEEIEVPLEREASELANEEILADLHSIQTEENKRKLSSLSHSRNTLRPKRKKKAKRYRKKQLSQKIIEIPCAINEEEERMSMTSSKESYPDETQSRTGQLIDPEIGQSAEYDAGKGVKTIYWERKPSQKNSTWCHTDDKDAKCQNDTEETLPYQLQTPLSDSMLCIVEKPKIPSTRSTSAEQETTENKEILPSTDGKALVQKEENDQLCTGTSPANNRFLPLNCLNESLLALTTALDGNDGTYCKTPSPFPNIDVNQKFRDYTLFTKSQSLRSKREPSEVPFLLRTATFNSECVSILTSDFDDESDSGSLISDISDSTSPSETPSHSIRKQPSKVLHGDSNIEDRITSDHCDVGRTEENNRKDISLHCDHIEEGFAPNTGRKEPADLLPREVEIKRVCDTVPTSDGSGSEDSNVPVATQVPIQTSSSISGQEKVSADDGAPDVSSIRQRSNSDGSRSMPVDKPLPSSPPTPPNEFGTDGQNPQHAEPSTAIAHELHSTRIGTQNSC